MKLQKSRETDFTFCLFTRDVHETLALFQQRMQITPQ